MDGNYTGSLKKKRLPRRNSTMEEGYRITLAARKWPWDCNDMSTWKYSDFNLVEGADGKKKISWVENPGFAWKHRDRRYI